MTGKYKLVRPQCQIPDHGSHITHYAHTLDDKICMANTLSGDCREIPLIDGCFTVRPNKIGQLALFCHGGEPALVIEESRRDAMN